MLLVAGMPSSDDSVRASADTSEPVAAKKGGLLPFLAFMAGTCVSDDDFDIVYRLGEVRMDLRPGPTALPPPDEWLKAEQLLAKDGLPSGTKLIKYRSQSQKRAISAREQEEQPLATRPGQGAYNKHKLCCSHVCSKLLCS